MRRMLAATCLAATFAVGLAAQSTGTSGTATSQDPQSGGQRGGPRTVTGCLRAGDTAGSYMLTDVVMPGGRGRRDGAATSTGGTTAGSTAGTGTSTAGGSGTDTAAQGGRAMPPQSILLTAASDVDLKPHVGHKIEVTGTLGGGRGRSGDAAGSATGTGTGTGSSVSSGGQSTGRGPRSMTVTTVRMISESCS